MAVRLGLYYKMLLNPYKHYRGENYQSIVFHYWPIIQYFNNAVKNNRCPICGRVFRHRWNLYRHISSPRSQCGLVVHEVALMLNNHKSLDEIILFLKKHGVVIEG